MHRGIVVIGFILVLMLGLQMVLAGDDIPQAGTPADNECNPGGVLYRADNQDGCPTEWYWKAGWYLARFNRGLLSRENFPADFSSVLPPPIKKLDDPNLKNTVCATAVEGSDAWLGCVNHDQTGSESVNENMYSYLLFVNTAQDCQMSFNDVPFYKAEETQSHVITFYQFSSDELASIGGLQAITCIYTWHPEGS